MHQGQDIMEYISLLILISVAGFLFYQLRSVLGQVPYEKNNKLKDNQKVIELKGYFKQKITDLPTNKHSNDEEYLPYIKESNEEEKSSILNTLKEIKSRYPAFEIKKFIEGSKGAYDMILESFNKDLPENIKNFVSNDIYNSYRKLLDSYKEKKFTYETIVTRIDNIMILSAETDYISAKIKVELTAHNISVLKDESGKVIQGDPDNVIAVTDIWVFEREYNSQSPIWIVTKV